MPESVPAGSWVELERVVLPAGERAAQVPAETQSVPLVQRVKGWLVTPARIGDAAEIETAAGRRMRGTLRELRPAYTHGFGSPIEALLRVGDEVRARLRASRGSA